MAYGGNGVGVETGANPDIQADYMFPGDTDPFNWGTEEHKWILGTKKQLEMHPLTDDSSKRRTLSPSNRGTTTTSQWVWFGHAAAG